MFKFGSIFLASVCSLMLKMIGLIYKHVYGSKSSLAEEKGSNFSENRSQPDEKVVSQNSNVVFADENECFDLQKNDSFLSRERECSVSLPSGLVSKNSKCQIFSCENVSGFLEEAKTVKFVVQEMFVESDNQCIGAEIMGLEQNLEENRDDFDEEAEVSPFYFKLFDASLSTNDQETRASLPEREEIGEECFDHEEADDNDENPEFDQLIKSSHFSDQESDADDKNDEILIIPPKIEKNDSENWMSSFLDQNHFNESSEDHENEDAIFIQTTKSSSEEDEDEFVELEHQSLRLSHFERESGDSSPSSSADATEKLQKCRDSDEDEDEDEADVLSQHQHLVEQMKMELKNCRIRGLPTISEESENPKIIEDLRPLKIDHKIGYKDVIRGIHNFYKSYAEKMRKLDILNYQTSHAISFLRLKESEVFRAGKKRSNSLLPKILAGKVRRVYAADPMHKSIQEMQRDLEVVYVGQLCLSWEILWWLDARTRELLEYECKGRGSNSYNRAAEEFQQFQVLVQRFMEDELFQGRRHDNYVKSRCLIRSLLQVPTIKDDCLKTTNKERREETDKITLEMLVGIIAETMVIFQEFVLADKKATSSSLTTKVDVREPGSSELLWDVICSLEKKDRRMKEQMRRQNCIVKKLKKQQRRRVDREMLAAQVDLRLIWRVLNMERLSEDRLVWCKKKLSNINFVGRKVRREACFLLFPC